MVSKSVENMEEPCCVKENGKCNPKQQKEEQQNDGGALCDIPLEEEARGTTTTMTPTPMVPATVNVTEEVELTYSQTIQTSPSYDSGNNNLIKCDTFEDDPVVKPKDSTRSSDTKETSLTLDASTAECDCNDDLNVKDVDEVSATTIFLTGRTLCVILTISMILITGTGLGFALFPRTRFWALVVFLPLLVITLIAWITLMCYISSDDDEEKTIIAVIEPCDLPPSIPINKTKTGSKDSDGTTVQGTIECSEGTTLPPEEGVIERNFPELHKMFMNVQHQIDETKEYVLRRVVKPAATLCRPTSPIRPTRTQSFGPRRVSFGARPLSAGARSMSEFVNQPDVECCTDVYCLRNENGVINLSGKYKLIHNDNFEEFLKSLNIPALFRRAANSARPIHKYTHEGDIFRVQIEGIIKGDTTFTVYGPPTVSTLRNIKFLDHVSYMEDKGGIIVRKVIQNRTSHSSEAVAEIVVTRKLSKSGKKLLLVSEAIQADGFIRSKAVQTFLRM